MVVLSLFSPCLLLLPLFVGVLDITYLFCFVLQNLVSFLVLQLSRWRRESWLLYLCSVMNVMSLLSFFDSSSWCHGLVCNK